MKRIFMDHGGTSRTDPEVIEAMLPYFSEKYGNPSSLHSFGREAKEALEKSRETIAKVINANPEEVFFTSGGTESNNWVLKGIAFANKDKGIHIIVSKIEHPCIIKTCEWLEKNGFEVTYLPVDKYGLVKLEELEKAITDKTILVSIMYANNEIGTIEPIEEIGKLCREKGVYFHTDAVQAIGKIPVNVEKLNVDLLTFLSHKIHGPKGVGALYVRKGVKIDPLIHGGGQENGRRSGTENVSGIVGFAKAVEMSQESLRKDIPRIQNMRDRLIKEVLKIENSYLNGHPTKRLPHNAHFMFDFIEGESLILRLDAKGIALSTGSACSSVKLEPSHVLLAIGQSPEQAHGSLRLTLGKWNTDSDIDYVLKVLPEEIKALRAMSPFKKDYEFKASEGYEK